MPEYIDVNIPKKPKITPPGTADLEATEQISSRKAA
jgi:hypothetical protein